MSEAEIIGWEAVAPPSASAIQRRKDRVAFAAACRRLGAEYGLNMEHIARQPDSFARTGDAAHWKALAASTYRHGLGLSGDAGRLAYHRAKRQLWDFVFSGPDGGRELGYKRPVVIWDPVFTVTLEL